MFLRSLLSLLLLVQQPRPSFSLTCAFLYGWYGTPDHDGRWQHWNHSTLEHWTPSIRAAYPRASFVPPADLHSPFYPSGGPYSSRDEAHLAAQLSSMARAGVRCAIVSWLGREGVSGGDSQGVLNDDYLARVMAAAGAAGVAVAPHLEPYAGRDAASLRADVAHLVAAHGARDAWLRERGERVFYVYDSYHLPEAEWALLLRAGGDLSLRGGALDGFFLGLWLERGHGAELARSGFDGAYTYFAAEGFSFGSTTAHWRDMAAAAERDGLLFVPCVGPGYDDSRIRPWNAAATRPREGGAYYRRMWGAAIEAGATTVAVTSFNEWGEGTQIEAAEPRSVDVDALAPLGRALNASVRTALRLSDIYLDYAPHAPTFYLELTAELAARLEAEGGRRRREEL